MNFRGATDGKKDVGNGGKKDFLIHNFDYDKRDSARRKFREEKVIDTQNFTFFPQITCSFQSRILYLQI